MFEQKRLRSKRVRVFVQLRADGKLDSKGSILMLKLLKESIGNIFILAFKKWPHLRPTASYQTAFLLATRKGTIGLPDRFWTVLRFYG